MGEFPNTSISRKEMETLPEEMLVLILEHENMLTTLGSTCRRMRRLSLGTSPISLTDRRARWTGALPDAFVAMIPFATDATLHEENAHGFLYDFVEGCLPVATWHRLKHLRIDSTHAETRCNATLNIDAPELISITWIDFSIERHGLYFHPDWRDLIKKWTPKLADLCIIREGFHYNTMPISYLAVPSHPLSIEYYRFGCIDEEFEEDMRGLRAAAAASPRFFMGRVVFRHHDTFLPDQAWINAVEIMATDPVVAPICDIISITNSNDGYMAHLDSFVSMCQRIGNAALVPISLINADIGPDHRLLHSDRRFYVNKSPRAYYEDITCELVFDPMRQ